MSALAISPRFYRTIRDEYPALTPAKAMAAARVYEEGSEFSIPEAVCAVTTGHDFVCGSTIAGDARYACRHCAKGAEA
jgi:hypothetical protein